MNDQEQELIDEGRDDSKPYNLVVYLGPRPFKMDAADEPVMPADFITEDHPYYKHLEQLLERSDFKELKNG